MMKGSEFKAKDTQPLPTRIKRWGIRGFSLLALSVMTAQAEIAQVPLVSVPQSNILFLVDDALNLDYELLLPAELQDKDNQSAFYLEYNGLKGKTKILPHCAGYNELAYDPSKTYKPWWGYDSEGNLFDDQGDITAVPLDPYLPATDLIDDLDQLNLVNSVDLSEHFYTVWNDAAGEGEGEYDAGECPVPAKLTYGCVIDGDELEAACVTVSDMDDSQQKNFANWYAYHRKREYVLKYALAEVINKSEARIGIGFTSVNEGSNVASLGIEVKDVDDITVPVDSDAVVNKRALLDRVFALDAKKYNADKAHVRRMLEAAGNYYERDETYDTGDSSGVVQLFGYANNAAEPESPIVISDASGTCQKNATIVIGSRFDNSADGSNYSERIYRDDIDSDGYIDTMADVAAFFYNRDLYPDVDNPDMKQNMSTYSVAVGVNQSGHAWAGRVNNKAETIDDMYRAASNSDGEFHSPDNGEELTTALQTILFDIDKEAESTASSTSLASVSSLRASSDTTLYVTRFTAGTWEGQLLAYPVDADSLALGDEEWDASKLIPAHANRKIFSYNDTAKGFAFNSASWAGGLFTAAQKTSLNTLDGAVDTLGADRVEYLRGDQSDEGNTFRARSNLLGDIVNSDAYYTADENHGYYGMEPAEDDGTESYYHYLSTEKTDRQPMVYVGANDGMLHAVSATEDADTGAVAGGEVFAYIPESVYGKLSELTDPDYDHNYYVDGPAIVSDAYFNYKDDGLTTTRWGSVLVGSLGFGGDGVFALDVSDPLNFDENDVLWDLDKNDLPNLGSLPGRISVAKLPDGTWAAIFGNGYGSDAYKAGLYIVPLDDPDSAIFIDTEKDGTSDAPNGLSAALPADTDGDGKADRVYAGDLLGNMWVFDLSNETDSNSWSIAHKSGNTPAPLFTACIDADCSETQAITSRPEVVAYDDKRQIVLFGTGRYFEIADITSVQKQTFYGVLDDGSDSLGRADLQQQTIELEYYLAETGRDYRVTSQNSVDYSSDSGWYLDFDSPNYVGERIISDPIVRNGRVLFTTFVVDDSVCSRDGGESWYLDLSAKTGARPGSATFDVNGDGAVDDNDDYVDPDTGEKSSHSGVKIETGLAKTGKVFDNGAAEKIMFDTSSGSLDTIVGKSESSVGRQSWLQIH